MRSMICYLKAAVERAMKIREVILRAVAKRITWWQAAEIMGITDRSMRRWRERYEEFGYDGPFDWRQGRWAFDLRKTWRALTATAGELAIASAPGAPHR